MKHFQQAMASYNMILQDGPPSTDVNVPANYHLNLHLHWFDVDMKAFISETWANRRNYQAHYRDLFAVRRLIRTKQSSQ